MVQRRLILINLQLSFNLIQKSCVLTPIRGQNSFFIIWKRKQFEIFHPLLCLRKKWLKLWLSLWRLGTLQLKEGEAPTILGISDHWMTGYERNQYSWGNSCLPGVWDAGNLLSTLKSLLMLGILQDRRKLELIILQSGSTGKGNNTPKLDLKVVLQSFCNAWKFSASP